MYGCADGYIIYGFKENESDCFICWDFLEKYNILSFHSEVVRCHAGEFIYGLRCSLNKSTGQASIKADKKAIVEAAYAAACKVNGDSKYSGLGYFIAVTMDDTELCHTEYDPRKPQVAAVAKGGSEDDNESDDFAIETRTQSVQRKAVNSSITATNKSTTSAKDMKRKAAIQKIETTTKLPTAKKTRK